MTIIKIKELLKAINEKNNTSYKVEYNDFRYTLYNNNKEIVRYPKVQYCYNHIVNIDKIV